jgi:hypothetical protein
VAEGRKWATAVTFELAKRNAAHIFILGAGSGYHLQALKEIAPAIDFTALDPSAEVVAGVSQIHPGIQSSLAYVSSVDAFLENTSLRANVLSDYRMFAHGATVQLHSGWAGEIEEFLLARTPAAFCRQVELRPELRDLLSEEKIASVHKDLLSIKDLQSFFHPKASTKERSLWRVLEELIA